ncbi:MAG: methyltransferase [Pirellulales bacterium]
MDNDRPNLRLTCAADIPVARQSCCGAAFPCSAQGDAELTRELLQTAHEALVEGATLWVATDNPRDRWLRGELEKLFPKVRGRSSAGGMVYSAIKTGPLRKLKDFTCWFAFRDGPRLLRVVTRPGVFSHRHLDTGARALIESMAPAAGARVFDLGCGAGVVSLAAAARSPEIVVRAVDANPRAVDCTQRAAAANDLPGINAILDADATCDTPGQYDLAVANPPYYSRQRIAELFVDGGWRALRAGGELLIVTKAPEWYLEHLPERFDRVSVDAVRAYFIVRAVRP